MVMTFGVIGSDRKTVYVFMNGVAKPSRYLADLIPKEKCVSFEQKQKTCP
jgi:hypothetical protein